MLENACHRFSSCICSHCLDFLHFGVYQTVARVHCEAWPRAISEGNALVLNTVGVGEKHGKIWDGEIVHVYCSYIDS